ncbi:hypothetical protein GCM10020229_54260 [Kitasatospora albolonga]
MAGGLQAAVPVGGADRRHPLAGVARRVQHHERDVPARQLLLLGAVQAGEHQQDTGGTPGEHAVHPGLAGAEPAGGLGEHYAQALLPGHVLHPADHLHRPDALQFVEDQLQQRGGLGGAAPPPVAVPPEQVLHPLPGGRGDVGPAVQDFRNSRGGHPRFLRDLGERGCSGHDFLLYRPCWANAVVSLCTARILALGRLRSDPAGPLDGWSARA